jgi:hypothetical protein
MVAFRSAHDTVNAAAEIQRQLAVEQWPDVPRYASGSAFIRDSRSVAARLHSSCRAAGSVAHGGQVVLRRPPEASSPRQAPRRRPRRTRSRTSPPPNVSSSFSHRGSSSRAPRRSPPTSRPRRSSDEPESARRGAVADDRTRLVTLTGTGGAGKSRLALEAGRSARREFPDGVYLVSLAPITDPDLVLAEIARVLGVRDTTSRPRVEALADALRGRRVLLVIDNFEHVAAAANDLSLLLRRAPDPVVLATSRRRLRISGEHVVTVGPLTDDDAATLFLERASAADPLFR